LSSTYKFGNASLLFNGTNHYLELSGTNYSIFNFGTNAFTVEFQVNFTATTGTQTFTDFGGTAAGLVVQYLSGTGLQVIVAGTTFSFTWSPTTATWYHVAVVRSGTSLYAFVNGSQVGTTQTNSGSITCGSSSPTIGCRGRLNSTVAPTNFLAGYLDEFAVHNNAKWTSGFTTPITAYEFASITNIGTASTEPVDAGMSFVSDGLGNTSIQSPTKTFTAQFALTESVSNTTKYFYAYRSAGATQEDAKRSGNSNGIGNPNSCSPTQMPFNGRLVKALLSVQGAGVNQGAATYPCLYQIQLYRVGWTTEHDSTINGGSPVQINFPIYSGVGAYTVGATNTKSERTDLEVSVNTGDLLAVKFLNGATASLIGLSQSAFVTLVFEEVL
jgi:hypothetical protein